MSYGGDGFTRMIRDVSHPVCFSFRTYIISYYNVIWSRQMKSLK